MVESKLRYEQIRRERLEENKKRMEELNLNKLSQAFSNTSPKPSPAKQAKPRVHRQPVDLSAVRRSSRVADKPPPSYKEVPIEPLESLRRTYHRRDLLNRVYASDEARMYAIDRAEQAQSGLEPDFPSFVKPMLQSHVTGGFWLGLPLQFCKKHLPRYDEIITLTDENGDEFLTKYLAEKAGLSGGWRGFSIDHQLVDGDALVFQLVRPAEFKVHIIRAYDEDNEKDSDVTHVDKSDKRMRANSEDNEKDSDVTQVDKSAKQIRAKDNEKDVDVTHLDRSAKRPKRVGKEDNEKDSDVTQVDKSAKQIRAKDNEMDSNVTHLDRSAKRPKRVGKNNEKDSDVTHLDRSAKRPRRVGKKDSKKDSDVTHLDRSAKRPKRVGKKDNEKDSDVTHLERSAKRPKRVGKKDNEKDSDVTHLERSAKRPKRVGKT